ncbi:NAD(P)H-binding protein [Demequina sp. NBRC 110053]|uniref:NAD(P)H-binding protein n=1 Tax=Demequina sp. NBRC 110053 TaxID=1570342 RepID=UPI000A05D535|nr:NAD(P)H-binding protein [Demequina sp. NBRC 110053]
MSQQSTAVVLGATGKTGRRVAARLEQQGVEVRRASRGSSPRFDWEDPSTWAPVIDGADAVYMAFAPDLGMPGAPETAARAAELARTLGATRLALLSGRGETEAQRAEAMVAQAFPERTVLRCAFFAQNFDESFLLEPLRAGMLALPVTDVAEPFVDLEDVAEVAVAALTSDAHAGRIYELTGPRSLTFAEAVAEMSGASGRPMRYHPISLEDFAASLAAEGMSTGEIDLLRYLFTEVLDGRNSMVTDGVEQALGRPATDFRDYAARVGSTWAVEATA